MTPQVKSIIAHITLIGWIISLILNSSNKDEMTSFYLRQVLGLYLLGIVGSLIPATRIIIAIIVFIFWLMSLIGAIQNKKEETPFIGRYFQNWFKVIE
ncbi:MAG: hypothetical protein RBS73_15640 [Prolixibacteraceae bacterium]|jgi:hypothetical protein|nr:hypothetical protein [Prolixibacteraceae bacterium]